MAHATTTMSSFARWLLVACLFLAGLGCGESDGVGSRSVDSDASDTGATSDAEWLYCERGGNTGLTPFVDTCPEGTHCVFFQGRGPCYDRTARCEPIPGECPPAAAADAVEAICHDDEYTEGEEFDAPSDGAWIYPSECHARSAGYRWQLVAVGDGE